MDLSPSFPPTQSMYLKDNRMNLNLGCGPDSFGDVRLDVDYRTQIGDKSMLNIRGDAHHLPFKDKSFEFVRCYHVLEHVKDPNRVLQEIQRVSCHADIRFPVDDGYKKYILLAFLNIDYSFFRGGFKTLRNHAHLWIIKSKSAKVSTRYIEYPLTWFTRGGRKAKFFRKIIPVRRYYSEYEIQY